MQNLVAKSAILPTSPLPVPWFCYCNEFLQEIKLRKRLHTVYPLERSLQIFTRPAVLINNVSLQIAENIVRIRDELLL